MIRQCHKHGAYEHVLERKYWCCKRCRNDRVRENRLKKKRKLVEIKGGKCEKCGYNRCLDALHFHHTDKKNKDFIISGNKLNLSLERILVELEKCVMLCANCHAEEHSTTMGP